MPSQQKPLVVQVDKKLAARYKTAYARVFGKDKQTQASLAKFVAGFVEDRLNEELEFLRREANEVRE